MRSAVLRTASGGFNGFSRRYSQNLSEIPVFPRVQELRKKLAEEGKTAFQSHHVFQVSERGREFLKGISGGYLNAKYSRGGQNGEGYVGIEEVMKQVSDRYYNSEEASSLREVAESIQDRMRVKISKSYLDHAFKVPREAVDPNPILRIVMPDSREVEDLTGEVDPSNQNRYSPLPGLLHKYEMLLALVSINCSSHCRYCYRLDLFNGTSDKSKSDMPVIAAYIKAYNELVDDAIAKSGVRDEKTGLWLHQQNHEPLLHVREVLLSGGDPMTLPNATIARYMALLSEAGVNTIRIGTKEMAFNPERFDSRFFEVMDRFHETYPEVKLEIVGHYSHPYELVEPQIDRNGKYLYDIDRNYRIRKEIRPVLKDIKEREWIGHYNQFPIISGVNDSPEVLRLLIYQTARLGITMHNIYACREIVGNTHFRGGNTIEDQYNLVEQAKVGLSGLQNHARLIMSTEYGKVEVCGVEDGKILLKINRFVGGDKPDKTIIRVDPSKLPKAKFYWLDDESIELAISDEGREALQKARSEDGSIIKQFKKIAAASALRNVPQNDNEDSGSVSACGQKVMIEIVNRKGGSQIIYVDLPDEKYLGAKPTLATILAEREKVEAACKEQLSCSTCVVEEVEINGAISEPKGEDEKDLIDSAVQNPSTSVRAACQIPLKAGDKIKVKLMGTTERKEDELNGSYSGGGRS